MWSVCVTTREHPFLDNQNFLRDPKGLDIIHIQAMTNVCVFQFTSVVNEEQV